MFAERKKKKIEKTRDMNAQILKVLVKIVVATTLTAAGTTLGKHAAKEVKILLNQVR